MDKYSRYTQKQTSRILENTIPPLAWSSSLLRRHATAPAWYPTRAAHTAQPRGTASTSSECCWCWEEEEGITLSRMERRCAAVVVWPLYLQTREGATTTPAPWQAHTVTKANQGRPADSILHFAHPPPFGATCVYRSGRSLSGAQSLLCVCRELAPSHCCCIPLRRRDACSRRKPDKHCNKLAGTESFARKGSVCVLCFGFVFLAGCRRGGGWPQIQGRMCPSMRQRRG